MDHSCFFRIFMIAIVIAISCILLLSKTALTNESYLCIIPLWYWLSISPFNMPDPMLLIYLDSLCHETYNLYLNTISSNFMLGCSPYTPFLSEINSGLYDMLGISTYPNLGSQHHTTFPYKTILGTMIPYARFDYPVYVYGSPDFYLSWVLLQ